MQYTLTFTHKKKKYVSKPFDFEAMCLINDKHTFNKDKGVLTMCHEAVDYMFEGTEATQDIINAMSVNTRSRLCYEVWKFYLEALQSKNE